MKHLRKIKFTDIVFGIIVSLFIISLSVILTLNFRPLYYFDINHLNIVEKSGYSKEDIIANYDALIEYNSPFYKGELSFPTLPSSPEGIQHFEEVKDIFTLFYIIALITFVLTLLIIIYKRKYKDYTYVLTSSLSNIILPILVCLFIAIDFDRAFVIFHKIFFNNDYWIFDPNKDPIILTLPDTFFLHAALIIISLVLVGSLLLILLYLKLTKGKANEKE